MGLGVIFIFLLFPHFFYILASFWRSTSPFTPFLSPVFTKSSNQNAIFFIPLSVNVSLEPLRLRHSSLLLYFLFTLLDLVYSAVWGWCAGVCVHYYLKF